MELDVVYNQQKLEVVKLTITEYFQRSKGQWCSQGCYTVLQKFKVNLPLSTPHEKSKKSVRELNFLMANLKIRGALRLTQMELLHFNLVSIICF